MTKGKPTSLADVFRRALDAARADIHTALPGKVAKVNRDSKGNIKSVDVKPLIKVGFLTEDETRNTESLPVIPSVPVKYSGGGGARLTFPLKDGDVGLLIFCEASLDKWLTKGGEVDPEDDRRHTLSDAVFAPGLSDFAHALASNPSDHMTLGYDGDSGMQIHIDNGKITLGSFDMTQLSKIVLETPMAGWISSAQSAFAAHTHPTAVGPSGPPVGVLPSAPADLGSSVAYAKK